MGNEEEGRRAVASSGQLPRVTGERLHPEGSVGQHLVAENMPSHP